MIVGAYRHFWRFFRGVYGWIDDLRRDYLPDHLRPALAAAEVSRAGLVRASETLTENDFLLETAQEAGFVGGIVAWLDLSACDPRNVPCKFSGLAFEQGRVWTPEGHSLSPTAFSPRSDQTA